MRSAAALPGSWTFGRHILFHNNRIGTKKYSVRHHVQCKGRNGNNNLENQSSNTKSTKWGNENRLGPRPSPPIRSLNMLNLSSTRKSETEGELKRAWRSVSRVWNDLVGEMLYRYYNWRQDTLSDLQLFVAFNAAILGLGAVLHHKIVEASSPSSAVTVNIDPDQLQLQAGVPEGSVPDWWSDIYRVLMVVLGQDLPPQHAGFALQAFGVATAVLGLASFALVLALIEQVVLEVLEGNVRRGSRVYETNHYVVVAWGESARDLAQVTRVLLELCAAFAAQGGTSIAVLIAQREKLEMESMYREAVPMERRYGSQLVFRQGSPLDPAALRLVSAHRARSVVIMGDYSRPVRESDAQVLRCAVLLDELAAAEGNTDESTSFVFHELPSPIVIADVQGSSTPDLISYACSDRVIPVRTSLINARRYARLLQHPVIASISHALFDHTSQSHCDIVPLHNSLEGLEFAAMHALYPYSIVAGIIDAQTGETVLNPLPSTRLEAGKGLVMLRSAALRSGPLRTAMPGYLLSQGWDPGAYVLRSSTEEEDGGWKEGEGEEGGGEGVVAKHHPLPQTPLKPKAPPALGPGARTCDECSPGGARSDVQRYLKPLQSWQEQEMPAAYFARKGLSSEKGRDVLVTGWAGHAFMAQLLQELDSGAHALPPGTNIIIVNDYEWQELAVKCKISRIKSLRVHHVKADPRDRAALSKAIDISRLAVAIVMHDKQWSAKWSQAAAAPYALCETDMMRMDAEVLTVQLNIRYLLEESGLPEINIISEKLTYVGHTRFENLRQLPLGCVVNSASYAAKALAQVAVQPATLSAYHQLGLQCDIKVQDASNFSICMGEETSFLQLQARCASVHQVLLGWYRVPSELGGQVEIVVNPQGVEERAKHVVWDRGDGRCKLITLAPKPMVKDGPISNGTVKSSSVPVSASSMVSMMSSSITSSRGSEEGSVNIVSLEGVGYHPFLPP